MLLEKLAGPKLKESIYVDERSLLERVVRANKRKWAGLGATRDGCESPENQSRVPSLEATGNSMRNRAAGGNEKIRRA